MANTATMATTEKYTPKDFKHLLGTPGFSDKLLNDHFKLYEGYVKNTNALNEELIKLAPEGQEPLPAFSELRRRFGWEFNGMRLHEYYFGNLGAQEDDSNKKQAQSSLAEQFGTFEKWKESFIKTGAMRGIGWAILYRDGANGRLFNCWVNEHDMGHLAGCQPILVLDVFEHAFMTDYGLERKKYLSAFFDQINWAAVQERLDFGGKRQNPI